MTVTGMLAKMFARYFDFFLYMFTCLAKILMK